MLMTLEYARIVCSKCKKEVAVIIPGKKFDSIPPCSCTEPKKVVKKTTRKKVDEKNI